MRSKIRRIKYLLIYLKTWIRALSIHLKRNRCIYFIATPIYNNLGDYAIVAAQYKIMRDIGVEQNVIELNRDEYEHIKEYLKGNIIRKNDIIIIDGGGNIGTLWIEEEYKMRDIVQRFSDNPIYIFPQTAYFDDTISGNEELKKSIDVYNGHSDLTIFCRDIDTYLLFQNKFNNVKSVCTPDIVLYLKPYASNQNERRGGKICLRSDIESIGSGDKIRECVKASSNENISEMTTMSSKHVNRFNRKRLLYKKWDEFASAQFVITDRLHGMIFSAITGTPCLALDNISHKVKNGYKWVSHLPYIIYCENNESIQACLNQLLLITEDKYEYDKAQLKPYFDTIQEKIVDAYSK